MLLALTGLGRPHLEGGGVIPSDSLESAEGAGVAAGMGEMLRQGGESSLERQSGEAQL